MAAESPQEAVWRNDGIMTIIAKKTAVGLSVCELFGRAK